MIWKVIAHLSKRPGTRKRERVAKREERLAEARANLHEAMQEFNRSALPSPGGLPGAEPIGEAFDRVMRGDQSPFPMPRMDNVQYAAVRRDVSLAPRLNKDGKAVGCPDGGVCHHAGCERVGCFRVQCCGPLSGVFPGDVWPRIR